MRNVRLFRALLGVDKRTVIEDIEFEEDDAGDGARVIARVRPRSAVLRRCGRCGRKASWYDRGAGLRQWRSLDWGTVEVFLEAEAPRVNCPTHGPTVVAVPWARHHAGHTYAFDDTVAWLAVACSKTAVCELMRIAWRTVGAIVARVWADTEKRIDRFANLRRIGIDEISYKRHHRYLTVVVDHDSGRLVWAAPGHRVWTTPDPKSTNPRDAVLADRQLTPSTHKNTPNSFVVDADGRTSADLRIRTGKVDLWRIWRTNSNVSGGEATKTAADLVARGGIEPPTFRFSGGRSYRLSYLAGRQHVPHRPGDPDGTRTRDLRRDRAAR